MTQRLWDTKRGPIQPPNVRRAKFLTRLLSRRVGFMLVRNTVVSTSVFLLGLGLLWMLVSWGRMNEIAGTAIGFIISNTAHYALGRTWIFRGTTRGLHSGYAIFLANSSIGLVVTVGLFTALLHFTWLHYLVARTIVSVFAGLAVFVLNASLNFRQV